MAALTIGNRFRDALGTDAGCVEEVRALSANALRDRIYRALNQGTACQPARSIWRQPTPNKHDIHWA